MKKYALVLAVFASMPVVSAMAYGYSQPERGYYTQRATTKTSTYNKTGATRKTGGRTVVSNNIYYNQPKKYQTVRSVETNREYSYEDYGKNTGYYVAPTNKKQTKTVKKSYSSKERKFFLAHPFFQPLQGHVGSVTDFSYAKNSFNFDLLNGRTLNLDPASSSYLDRTPVGPVNIAGKGVSGKAETSQFAVKEDLSYGLTDSLALVLMAQYDKTKTTFKIDDASDSKSDSGLNLFGIGLQNRFVDNNDWIVMGEAFFEHQKDVANTFMLAVKAGYKIDRTTVYGIGRVAYTNLINGDTYGAYVDDSTGDWLMLSYNTDVKNIFQAEGGLGAFAVLNKYFTLNGEMIYGHYDWHNQLNIKGALGWQPADHFALNIYASTVLYDSAKGKIRRYMDYDVDPEAFPEVNNTPVFTDSKLLYTDGDYKIKDYREWKIGVQAILHF